MAASDKTIGAVHAALRRHLDLCQMEDLIIQLKKIDGNASFRETVRRLEVLHDYEKETD